jgi:hypothetical protein
MVLEKWLICFPDLEFSVTGGARRNVVNHMVFIVPVIEVKGDIDS